MAKSISPDPIPIDDGTPDRDYQAHVRTFNAFLGAVKWFVTHLVILVVALYSGVIAGQPWLAFFLVFCSIAQLVFGMLRRPGVRADVMKGLAAAPGAGIGHHTDHSISAGDRTA